MTKSACQANEMMFPTTAPGRPGRPLCPGRPISPCSPLAPWETDTTGIKQLYLFPHRAAPLLRNLLGGDSQQLITDRWGTFILPRMTDDPRRLCLWAAENKQVGQRQRRRMEHDVFGWLTISTRGCSFLRNYTFVVRATSQRRTYRWLVQRWGQLRKLLLFEEVCKYFRIMFRERRGRDNFHQCSSRRFALPVQHFVLDSWSDCCKSIAKRLTILILQREKEQKCICTNICGKTICTCMRGYVSAHLFVPTHLHL